jgi:ketose-bisphosphate aldolase
MPIVTMSDLLHRALRRGYAVGYFESWDQYSLEATLEAAEEARSPVILGIGGAVVSPDWLESRGLEELIVLARYLGERSAIPTAILLNEVKTMDLVRRGLHSGCNAVMLQSNHLSFAENVRLTKQVVKLAHGFGAAVEAELGHLADASNPGGEAAAATDPVEAARFVESTGIDALAVSVGNVHLLTAGEATVDLGLLADIRQAVSVPLVIHGGTGFPRHAVRPAIERGVAKFNVGTRLKRAFLAGLRDGLTALPDPIDYHLAVGSHKDGDVLGTGKGRLKREIVEWMGLYGSAGQAQP